MSRKSSTETLIAAMRVLASDIQSGDGAANAAIAEAADRLEEQQATIAELDAQAAIEWRAVLGLRALEWSRPVIDRNGFLGRGCIECGRDRERGHTEKCAVAAILRDAELAAPHSDDLAVDRFAVAMKAKLAAARAKGRGGWDDPEQCSVEFLAKLLIGHVRKGNSGNFEDIANLAMMLHQRGAYPAVLERAAPEPATVAVDARAMAELLEQAAEDIQEWGAYASAYFQEKHNLAANVAKYREAARRLLAGGK